MYRFGRVLDLLREGPKNGLHAACYNSAESEPVSDEIWNFMSQMLGAGHGRLWARSAQ